MKKIWETSKQYHQRKLKDAIEYLYPKNLDKDSPERDELLRITNRETEIGSFIDTGSDIICGTIDPMVRYELDSLLIALKGNLNFVDDGLSNSEYIGGNWGYSRRWCPLKREEHK